MAKANTKSLLTKNGKPRLGPLSVNQLQKMIDEAKRGRDRHKYQKELDRRKKL